MTTFRPRLAALLLAPLLALAAGGAAQAAKGPCPAGLPPGIHCGEPDAALAPAGAYHADPSHTAVLARVSHIGYSYSVFRFDKVKADLVWDAAAPDKSSLTATVEPGSIDTPVPGFATELAGPKYLKSADFPEARFVSTSFHKLSPTKGRIDGDLTLLGKTHKVSFDVTLNGAGGGFGHPRMGVHAEAWINPADYALSPFFDRPIELLIDAEFEKGA